MSSRLPSWLLPALSVVVTMLVAGGVMLYLNPDRASALDDVAPAGGSLVLAAAEDEDGCAAVCRSGSNVCLSASSCAGGSCTVEECVAACEGLGIECSEECIAACTNGACTGGSCTVEECVAACETAGVACTEERIAACTGSGQCSGSGACASVTAPARSGGCCSK